MHRPGRQCFHGILATNSAAVEFCGSRVNVQQLLSGKNRLLTTAARTKVTFAEIVEDAVCALARENQARRRAVREQSALGVGDAAFCRADTTAAVEDFALGPDLTRL